MSKRDHTVIDVDYEVIEPAKRSGGISEADVIALMDAAVNIGIILFACYCLHSFLDGLFKALT